MVDGDHGVSRVDPSLDEAHLDALGLGHRDPEVEGGPVDHRGHAPQPGALVDQVQRPELVVGAPAAPIGDPFGHIGESAGDRGRYGYGHAPVVADSGNL